MPSYMNPPDPPIFCWFFIPKATQAALSILQREKPTQASIHVKQASIQESTRFQSQEVYYYHLLGSISTSHSVPHSRFQSSPAQPLPTVTVPPTFLSSPLPFTPLPINTMTRQHSGYTQLSGDCSSSIHSTTSSSELILKPKITIQLRNIAATPAITSPTRANVLESLVPLSVSNAMPRIIIPLKDPSPTSSKASPFTGTTTGAKKEGEGEQQQQ